MNRYTTKHFWRMKEAEHGEWIAYSDHVKSKKSWHEYAEYMKDLFSSELESNKRLHRENDHYVDRILVLLYIVMATYGAIVAKLIFWSLGL